MGLSLPFGPRFRQATGRISVSANHGAAAPEILAPAL